jgi:hypothetical protein
VVQHFGVTKYQTIPVTDKVAVEVKPVFKPATVTPKAVSPITASEAAPAAAPAFVQMDSPALDLLGIPQALAATSEANSQPVSRPATATDWLLSAAALIWALMGATWFVEKEAEWAEKQKKTAIA